MQADRGAPLTRAPGRTGDPPRAETAGERTDAPPESATDGTGDPSGDRPTEGARGDADETPGGGEGARGGDVAGGRANGHPRRAALLALVATVTLLADLGSKVAVVAKLEDVDAAPVKLLGGLLYLVHTRNTGAAFSLASGFTVVLTAIAIGVVAFIVRTARRLYSTGWAVSLGLILGGAMGNLVDRLFRAPGPMRGGVVDFLALLDPYQPPWPVFNLADSALVVGVGIAIALELTGRRIDGRRVRQSRSD